MTQTPATGVRPDKHDFASLSGNSWPVHGGNHMDDTTGAIRTPIVMADSYRLPADPSHDRRPRPRRAGLHARARRQPARAGGEARQARPR
ncbi:MAG: hypothetical protein AVDCRST_MAG60-2567 [uncultured Nocardioides sp.]|uniref:Cystathionine gamma-lyase n=1 Tax=uncultured Nocardioides sp. TaxID=198441 RepID=A0A6J4PGA2_9ACTN|nr:MAG: hypothetical protein AVDCRST_MAG60-2567 [uncultured Nocardioides sp.]